MKHHAGYLLSAYLVLVLVGHVPAGASTLLEYRRPLTPAEQACALVVAGQVNQKSILSDQVSVRRTALDVVERSIRDAQLGEPYFRKVLDEPAMRRLRRQLEPIVGRRIPLDELAPTVNRAQVLLRESRGRESLRSKVWRDAMVDRPTIHGEIAELRLIQNIRAATGREMVLTKSPQSRVFDITEDKPNPRSGQLKVYKNPLRALEALQEDLAELPKRARYGWLPENQLAELVASGKLVARQLGYGPTVYRTTSGAQITVMPAIGIVSHADSSEYSATGRAGLIGLAADEPVVPRLLFAGEVAGGILEVYAAAQQWSQLNDELSGSNDKIRRSLLAARATSTTLTAASLFTSSTRIIGALPRVGRVAGRLALPLFIASQGMEEGIALYDYNTGRISRNQLIVRSAGPAAGLASVGVSAAAGAAVGVWFSGVGAVPGTLIGAGWGLVMAIPGSFAADYAANVWYSGLTAAQQKDVDSFVLRHYGLQ